MTFCECGCKQVVSPNRRFVSGHNLRTMVRTKEHCRSISEGQRRAWDTKRQRMAVGTTRISHDGYRVVKVYPGKGAWRPEHLLMVEAEIGRPLERQEVVHHVNAVRSDNTPDNLYLCRDRSHHNDVHRSYDELLIGLMSDGIVRFNRETGRYERVDNPVL